MSNRKRLIAEIAVAVFLVIVCIALWNSANARGERQLAEAEARHENAVAESRRQCESQVDQLAASEAESVFRAFAAGIQGSALSGQKGMLDMAKGNLLQLPHIAFVHVLAPDGAVLTSSNEKYAVAGRADDRAAWALEANELRTRSGDLPGTLEIAAPFQGASGRAAVLWLGYKTRELAAGTTQASGG